MIEQITEWRVEARCPTIGEELTGKQERKARTNLWCCIIVRNTSINSYLA